MINHGWLTELAVELADSLSRKQAGFSYTPTTTDDSVQEPVTSAIGDATEQAQQLDETSDPARKPDGREVHLMGLPMPPESFKHDAPTLEPLSKAAVATSNPFRKLSYISGVPKDKIAVAAVIGGSKSYKPSPSLVPTGCLSKLMKKASRTKSAFLPGMPVAGPAMMGQPVGYGQGFGMHPAMARGYGMPYGMPYGGLGMYGSPYAGSMAVPGMGMYGAPYNPITAGLAMTAMQGGAASTPGEMSSRMQDRRQQLEDAQSRMSEMNRSIQHGRGSRVSPNQLEQLYQQMQDAAMATGTTSRTTDSVFDPSTMSTRQVQFGGPGNLITGGGESGGIWDWLMGRNNSVNWQQYQRARQNYQNAAAAYAQWRNEQESQRDELRRSPFSVGGATQNLQRTVAEDEQDWQRRRGQQQQMWQLQHDAIRQATTSGGAPGVPGVPGVPPPPPGFSAPPAAPTSPPPAGAPHAALSPPPGGPVNTGTQLPGREVHASLKRLKRASQADPGILRKLIGDASKRVLIHGGVGGAVGSAAGLLTNRDGDYMSSIASGAGRGLRTGLTVGGAGELGALAGSGISSIRGQDFPGPGLNRAIGRGVGSLAGLAIDPTVQDIANPPPKPPSLMQRLGLSK